MNEPMVEIGSWLLLDLLDLTAATWEVDETCWQKRITYTLLAQVALRLFPFAAYAACAYATTATWLQFSIKPFIAILISKTQTLYKRRAASRLMSYFKSFLYFNNKNRTEMTTKRSLKQIVASYAQDLHFSQG